MTNTQSESPNEHTTAAMADDYYTTLGVERTASTDDINRAYRGLAKKLHPDRHIGKSTEEQAKAAETFKRVGEAHDVLSDPEKRSAYDMFGKAGLQDGRSAAAQEMFEEMYGMGASAKKTRMTGGALFVDGARGQFFQRSWDVADVNEMKAEMEQGLPTVQLDSKSTGHVMTTRLPHGAWDVRLIDVDANRGVVTVSLSSDSTSASNAEDGAAPLRVERTFTLPADADVDAVDATVDESGILKVAVLSTDAASPTMDDSAMSEASTVEAPMSSVLEEQNAAEGEVPPPSPLFVVGKDESPTSTTAALPKANRAARRRSKQTGLKAGFLNSKPKRSTMAPTPTAPSRPTSPVSVREELEKAMRAQVDELMKSGEDL